MIELRNIEKSYRVGDSTLQILKGISLTIEDGDFVAIMGPSGSGKSTLMNILGLLDVPTAGFFLFNGKEISQSTEDDLVVIRRDEIGFVFQQFHLLPRLSAAENVVMPLYYTMRTVDLSIGDKLLEEVLLGDRVDHRPSELSGGQQQRVAIARALVNRPRIILADEPTGNLDSISEKQIMGILRELNAQGMTVILVTHEEEIGRQAKRLIRMRDGVVQSDERLQAYTKAPPPVEDSSAKEYRGFHWSEFVEHFRQGLVTLQANKVRSMLSMLGVMIGVAAVMAMLAIGRGAQKEIEKQLAAMGSNVLMIRQGPTRVDGGVKLGVGWVTRLTVEDAAALKEKIPYVRSAIATVNGQVQVTYSGKNANTWLIGSDADYARMHAAEPEIGRFFSPQENVKRLRLVVIGMSVVKQLFPDRNPIGEMIRINKVPFQVIGILPEKGMSSGFQDQDDLVVMPVLTAMRRLQGKDYVDELEIEIDTPDHMEAAQAAALTVLFTRHRVAPSQRQDAFQIRNMADVQAAVSHSSKTMSLLLASIAAISLLVGGIGIMNIMLVSVTERTKEIGLRKAVGARRHDILLQFLSEAVVVSAIGGVAGVLLGALITVSLSRFAGWATSISPTAVVLSVLFSTLIGVIFGVFPARRASALQPIEALRYE